MEKKKLNELITYLLNSIKNAEKYAKQELPDIAKQYLENEKKQVFIDIGYNILQILFLFVVILILSYCGLNINTDVKENSSAEVGMIFNYLGCFVGLLGTLIFISLCVDFIITRYKYLIKLKIAPKVVLLNYFRNLLD